MGNKIFISYKYGDNSIQKLNSYSYESSRVRDYVDIIQRQLERQGIHINKGEKDGEDLSQFKNETIRSKLAEKIFDSSVTVVLISPQMKDTYKLEKDQWIPWEISYSLRLKRRRFDGDREQRSNRNGILLVYLPDKDGNYQYADYYPQTYLFNIINKNKNNLKHYYNHLGLPSSYFIPCTWAQFASQMNCWIEKANQLRKHADKYDIIVNID